MRLGLVLLVSGSLFVGAGGAFADEASKAPDTPATNPPAINPPETQAKPPEAPDPHRWCAPELASLSHDVCAFVPSASKGPRTLVIYLHGVIQPDTLSQWTLQRGAARVGATHGLTVIMPRGRRNIGPKTMEHWWTWPTSVDT